MDVSVNCASKIADGLRPRIDAHKVLASLPLGKRDEAVYGTTVAILPKEWEWQPCRLPGSQQAFRVGLVPQKHTGWSPHGSSLIDHVDNIAAVSWLLSFEAEYDILVVGDR